MNEKASVSKELNAQHAKILSSLLKLPQNKECADCGSKAPRWASINLGVFICLQCSGIHRSLGVHISKVRSTSLDTWLPEQVTFMQLMGNDKSNEYWEAELPPDFDRNPIEKFIHSKYAEKKWASTSLPQPMPEKSLDKCVSTSVAIRGIPKKARKYSLDEEFFAKGIPQIAPPTRSRAGSFDFAEDAVVPLPVSVQDDANRDLFSLLYVTEEKDRIVVPPSRWATFE